jgi:hypothetical protein
MTTDDPARDGSSQLCHEWNTVTRAAEFEGQPARRALTYDELQRLFDAADDRVGADSGAGQERIVAGVAGAALMKTVYAFGLRRCPATGRRHGVTAPTVSTALPRTFRPARASNAAGVSVQSLAQPIFGRSLPSATRSVSISGQDLHHTP